MKPPPRPTCEACAASLDTPELAAAAGWFRMARKGGKADWRCAEHAPKTSPTTVVRRSPDCEPVTTATYECEECGREYIDHAGELPSHVCPECEEREAFEAYNGEEI